jgi:hypothetical protein
MLSVIVYQYAECHLCQVSFKLKVIPAECFMLSVLGECHVQRVLLCRRSLC